MRKNLLIAIVFVAAGTVRLGYAQPAEPLERPAPTPLPAATPVPVETLNEAWQAALAASPKLDSKQHLVAAGGAEVDAAEAERYPQLQLGAGYTIRDREPAFRVTPTTLLPGLRSLPTAQQQALGAQGSITAPLYTSGRIQHGIAAASASQAAAEHHYQTAVAKLKLNVAQAYLAVLRDEQVLRVATTREKNLQSHLMDTKNRFDQQQVPRDDLLAAEVALANASQRRLQAENRLQMDRAQYNQLLYRPLTAPVHLAMLDVPPDLPSVDDFCQRALVMRPELSQLAAESRALDQQAGSVRAATKPQVQVEGQYVYEENRFRTPEAIAALTVGVQWNALDGARTRHRARAIHQRAASKRRALLELRSAVELEVRQAWLAASEAQQRITIAEAAVAQAEENLRSARRRYAAGSGTDTKVLDAVLLRSEAALNYHHAACDAVLAACHLRHAAGDL